MSEQKTQIAVRAPIAIGNRGIVIESIEALFRIAEGVQLSGLAPTSLKSKESIAIAMQMGMELGLPPMASLQNIAVVNGRPTLWGDAQLGVCRATGELEEFGEWFENKNGQLPRNPVDFTDDICAVCRVKRRGFEPQEVSFSVADAKRASLWGKSGPWTQYPARMLRYRARGFALRDNFGDALRGLISAEEAADIIDITPKESGPVIRERKQRTVATQETVVEQQQQEQQNAPTWQSSDPLNELSVNQNMLCQIVTESGGTFDDLIASLSKLAWFKDSSSWTSYAEIPDTAASRIIGAKRGIQTAIKEIVATRS